MASYTIRLTTSGTIYNLLSLVRAIDTDFRDCYPMVTISSDKDNTVPVYIGGAAVVATDYAFRLAAADDSITINPPNALASLGGLYAVAGANDQDLNILAVG